MTPRAQALGHALPVAGFIIFACFFSACAIAFEVTLAVIPSVLVGAALLLRPCSTIPKEGGR